MCKYWNWTETLTYNRIFWAVKLKLSDHVCWKWDIIAAADNGKDRCPMSQEKIIWEGKVPYDEMGWKGVPWEILVSHRNGRIWIVQQIKAASNGKVECPIGKYMGWEMPHNKQQILKKYIEWKECPICVRIGMEIMPHMHNYWTLKWKWIILLIDNNQSNLWATPVHWLNTPLINLDDESKWWPEINILCEYKWDVLCKVKWGGLREIKDKWDKWDGQREKLEIFGTNEMAKRDDLSVLGPLTKYNNLNAPWEKLNGMIWYEKSAASLLEAVD